MANHLFGEIVEPTSRAVFEWDDIDTDGSAAPLTWKTSNAKRDEKVKMLYIVEGYAITDFMKRYVPGLKAINSVKKVNLELYNVDSTYVAMIKNYDILLSGEITQLLEEFLIEAENVVMLMFKSKSEYLGSEVENSCIVRGLYCNTDVHFAPKLKQPNIVSGASAGVFQLRSHLDKSASLYVCYVDSTDCIENNEVLTLLQKLNIKAPMKDSTFDFIPKSNMYI